MKGYTLREVPGRCPRPAVLRGGGSPQGQGGSRAWKGPAPSRQGGGTPQTPTTEQTMKPKSSRKNYLFNSLGRPSKYPASVPMRPMMGAIWSLP